MTPELLILNHHLSNRVFDFLLNDLACFSFRSAAAAEPVQQSLQKNLNPHRGSGQADIDEGQIESGNKKWRVFLCAARAVVLSRACNEVGHGRSPCALSRRFCAVKSGATGGGSFHDLRHTFATLALQNGVDHQDRQQYARSLLGGFHAGHLRPRHHRRPTQSGANNGQYPIPCGIDLSAIRSRWGQRFGQEKAAH